MQNLFIKIRCVSWKQLFFSCCLVCISMTRAFRCQYALENIVGQQTTGPWRSYTVPSVNRLLALALIYRAVGQQTPGTGVDIPCRRSTDSWHRREVCAKSVDRRLAFNGLTVKVYMTLSLTLKITQGQL